MSAVITEEELTESLAKVNGKPFLKLPQDLYIPPDALQVFLEAFEGPLDLLLYLIKKQNIDILNLPVADITRQYVEYVELMTVLKLDLAGEYLLMAATLAEIKSRMLLPRPEELGEDDDDPRADLIRRLQEYERFKQAAGDIDGLPRMFREIYPVAAEPPDVEREKPEAQVELRELLSALRDVLQRAEMFEHHHVQAKGLSIRERMTHVLEKINSVNFTDFSGLFAAKEGKIGVVVTFIAILELLKQSMIEMVQNEPFGPIHVKAVASSNREKLETS